MNIAVVAYPVMDDGDPSWIDLFRMKHDPQASRIGLHFTLVFPTEASPIRVAPEMEAIAESIGPISFAIRSAKIVRDALSGTHQIFLVPDEGTVEIATLHDRLYAGVLRPFLRSDITFFPHMTIGACPDSSTAEIAVDALDLRSRLLRGRIEQITLVDVGLPIVQPVATYGFQDALRPTKDHARE
jgi:2'-5' RNA ligase